MFSVDTEKTPGESGQGKQTQRKTVLQYLHYIILDELLKLFEIYLWAQSFQFLNWFLFVFGQVFIDNVL